MEPRLLHSEEQVNMARSEEEEAMRLAGRRRELGARKIYPPLIAILITPPKVFFHSMRCFHVPLAPETAHLTVCHGDPTRKKRKFEGAGGSKKSLRVPTDEAAARPTKHKKSKSKSKTSGDSELGDGSNPPADEEPAATESAMAAQRKGGGRGDSGGGGGGGRAGAWR